nr:MAG TPA: hypothetical protein [Caudoviricetes sp.]
MSRFQDEDNTLTLSNKKTCKTTHRFHAVKIEIIIRICKEMEG